MGAFFPPQCVPNWAGLGCHRGLVWLPGCTTVKAKQACDTRMLGPARRVAPPPSSWACAASMRLIHSEFEP